MKKLERLSINVRSTIGLSLILVFLGLGSCPVKKAFHALLEESSGKEQTQDRFDKARSSVNITCNSADNSISQKLSLPERAFTLSHSPEFFLTTFLRFDFPSLDRGYKLKYNQELSSINPDAVPVYLRNRILLI